MNDTVATPPAILGRQLKEKTEHRLQDLCRAGFWQCRNCHGINTREEREQGLPSNCSSCGSIRFKYHPPLTVL